MKLVVFLAVLAVPAIVGAEDASAIGALPDMADQLLISALQIQQTEMDCSHLVHYLYQQSGLYYDYANSLSLYKGEVQEFRQVSRPRAGDVIVWRGHAGIVVDPADHSFVSALRTGVKVSSYVSRYWKGRGVPRFFRYVGPMETPTTEAHLRRLPPLP